MANKTVHIQGEDIPDHGSIDLDAERVELSDGTRLTEERADQLADEVRHVAGRGRPSLTAPGRKSPQLRLSVPEQLRTDLKHRAETEHRSVSEIAREALEHYLAS